VRALIYVPIVHSEVDMGSMAEELKRRFAEAFGSAEWARRYSSVEAMWGRAAHQALRPAARLGAHAPLPGRPSCL